MVARNENPMLSPSLFTRLKALADGVLKESFNHQVDSRNALEMHVLASYLHKLVRNWLDPVRSKEGGFVSVCVRDRVAERLDREID